MKKQATMTPRFNLIIGASIIMKNEGLTAEQAVTAEIERIFKKWKTGSAVTKWYGKTNEKSRAKLLADVKSFHQSAN